MYGLFNVPLLSLIGLNDGRARALLINKLIELLLRNHIFMENVTTVYLKNDVARVHNVTAGL